MYALIEEAAQAEVSIRAFTLEQVYRGSSCTGQERVG